MNNNIPNADLAKIVKRLGLIKTLISLEETNDIAEQVSKLKTLSGNDAVAEIVVLLQQQAYGKAVVSIDDFLNSHHQIAFYIDPEIEALRFEAKALEKQLQDLSDEKAELDKLIHEFSVRHNKELGELILKILQFRKEQSKGTAEEEETVKDYEEFNANYESTKTESIAELTEEELKELKDKYRKASKLCHPDVVDEDQKEAAHTIFMELKEAYEKNNQQRVNEILEGLQKGTAFTSKADTANEKVTLIAELERLRQKLHELNKTIDSIKESEAFKTINSISDWDEYFAKKKQQLKEQLNKLETKTKN